ncbi:MAG: glycosyltransferase family 39 protein [Chloroflexi bacterium]|nr:glycosyltransferase family 39 protein [Chloroflexota bacterium]
MKRSTAVIVILVWLAFAVRVSSLASQSVWWDEAFTWQTTSHGWDNLWHMLQTGDRNPPLYFVLTTLWGSFGGWREFSLRFVPLASGLISVAFLFVLARRLFGSDAGTWTLFIAAGAPGLVAYSQEARMYALFFALTAATLYFAVRSAERDFADRRAQTTLLIVEALLLLTHYFAVPLIAALNVLVVGYFFKRRAPLSEYGRWLIGQLMAALPLIVWTVWVFSAPDSLIQATEQPPSFSALMQQVTALWLTGVRDLDGSLGPLTLTGLIVIGVAIRGAWLIDRRHTQGLLIFGALSLAIGFALTQLLTAFHPRYLLAFSVPVWVLFGAALSQIKAKLLALIVAVCLITAGWSAALNPVYAKDDVRDVAAYLRANAIATDVILVEANDYTLDYYDHGLAATHMITATTEAEALKQLRSTVGDARRVWLVHWTISTQDQAGYWRFLLEQAGRLNAWQSFHGYEVYGYDLSQAVVDPGLERGAVLITSGDESAITVAMDWPLANITAAADWQRLSMALIDRAGRRISSIDADLRAGRNYAVLPIPPGTPPVAHTVAIKFYNAQQASEPQSVGKITLPRSTSEDDPYRTLSGYHWQTPATPIDNLAAYSLSPQSPAPLGQVEVIFRWRKTTSTLDGRVRLVQADRVWAEPSMELMANEYPVEKWLSGETVIDRRTLIYPPVRGEMQLQIAQDERWLKVATLTLDESQLKFDAPALAHTQTAQFGAVADLLGYSLTTPTIAPDRELSLTLYWRARNVEPLSEAYTVFTQLIAPDGHLVAQHDAPPNPPTVAWVSGQIVTDVHALKLVDATYRGPATLIIGWYNSASVVRVPVATGGDFVTLNAPVEVQDR